MSQRVSDVNDTTPLLGSTSNATTNGDNNKSKQGVRQHLLAMTPRQSFLVLIVLAAAVFSSVYLLLHNNLPKDIPE